MSIILPELAVKVDQSKMDLLQEYARLLLDYNSRVNLMSRKSTLVDVERHIAHCLHMATRNFIAGAKIVDWGSGGGLPAIPLGILFPKIEIMAVDTVGKKTKAIGHFLDELGLENVKVWQGRAESYTKKFHYSVSRGTAPLTKLWNWHLKGRIPADPESNCWVPGLLTLKGGDLTNEIETLRVASRWVKVETISIPTIGGSPADEKYLLSVNDDKDTVVA